MLAVVDLIAASSFFPTFFFQAEDGIRERSPSRGLGDVYKRQVGVRSIATGTPATSLAR